MEAGRLKDTKGGIQACKGGGYAWGRFKQTKGEEDVLGEVNKHTKEEDVLGGGM